jgi:hypothetical protein
MDNIIETAESVVAHYTRAMYRDNDVDKYYDASLLANYSKRYLLFTGVIACLAFTAIVVALIIRTL